MKLYKALLFTISLFLSHTSFALTCGDVLGSNQVQVRPQGFSTRIKAPSIGPLFRGQNVYNDPLNRSQKDFMMSLGISFDGAYLNLPPIPEMAKIYNERVDRLVADGVVAENEAVYWGEILILNERRIVVRADKPWPEGATLFLPKDFFRTFEGERSRFISRREARRLRWQAFRREWNNYINSERIPGLTLFDRVLTFAEVFGMSYGEAEPTNFFFDGEEYKNSLTQGLFPVARPTRWRGLFNYTSDYDYFNIPSEYAFLHDIAHLGGMESVPEMMGFIRGANEYKEARSRVDTNRINESLVLTPKSRGFDNDFIQSASALPLRGENQTIQDYVDRLSQTELLELVRSIIEMYPTLRLPVGGAARTGSFATVITPERMTDFYFLQLRRVTRAVVSNADHRALLQESASEFEELFQGYGDVPAKLSEEEVANFYYNLKQKIVAFFREYDQKYYQSLREYIGLDPW